MFLDPLTYPQLLAAWLYCLFVVLWGQRREGIGTGLVISYVLQLWVLHWLAAALYTLPWYVAPTPFDRAGLQVSTVAIAGFAVGCMMIVPLLLRKHPPIVARAADDAGIDPRQVRTYLMIG